ncbi:hypothetical protein N1851_000542 [Merluccius polli]|uniref:Integrase catalytic domain-containing protein n=1 Tax=Merluccius polli TaxID=89951 RepID=A0AA47PDV3_MERPO|nr:hypothetical protein N1851_000542 [Merluccius polli]
MLMEMAERAAERQRQEALERDRLQMEMAERAAERQRQVALAREQLRAEEVKETLQTMRAMYSSRAPSMHGSRASSARPSRVQSPERAATGPMGPTMAAQLQAQLTKLKTEEQRMPPREPSTNLGPPARPARGRSEEQTINPVAQTIHYRMPPQVEGPRFPSFRDEDRSQYVELRICLDTLLDDSYSESYKYAILLQHVKNPRAHNMVLAHAASPIPYTKALADLDARYGRPWNHALAELRALEEQPPLKDERQLDDFTLRVHTLVGMLKTQGPAGASEITSTSNVERLLHKIPRFRQERFRRQQRLRNPGKLGLSLADFAEFLLDEVHDTNVDSLNYADLKREKEKERGDRGDRQVWNKGRPVKVMHTKEDPPTGRTSRSEGRDASRLPLKGRRSAPPCPYCVSEYWFNDCSDFDSLSTEAKRKWIEDNKRCWSCGRDHLAKNCTLKRKCNRCEEVHLNILHEVCLEKSKGGPRIPESRSAPEAEAPAVYYLDPSQSSRSKVLLKVVKVRLHHHDTVYDTYAVLDDGSERTILLQEAVLKLGLRGSEEKLRLRTIRRDLKEITGARVEFSISPAGRPSDRYRLQNVFTGDELALSRYDYPLERLRARYPHLRRVELHPIEGATPTLLIGSDNAALIVSLRPPLRGPRGCPLAVKTALGWALQGATEWRDRDGRATSSLHVRTEELQTLNCLHTSVDSMDAALLDNVQKLWTLDVAPYKNEKLYVRSKEDAYAMDLLKAQTVRIEVQGVKRYATPLLRREPMPEFRVSPRAVLQCLTSTEKRMRKDEVLAASYRTEMKKLTESGLVRKLEPEEADQSAESWYLPHHNVRHNEKNRVVFNCSYQVGKLNLNHYLLPGPTLTPSLLGVLVRFRQQPIAVSGDIKRMFHQVRLLEEDKPLMRFLWREDPSDTEPSIYQWEVLPFGTTCSPCCATYALQTHAAQQTAPPGVCDAVHRSFYVDNCLHSSKTVTEARQLVQDMRTYLSEGGFEICQWASNDPQVIKDLPEEAKSTSSEAWVSLSSDGAQEMTLGLIWQFQSDTLRYRNKPAKPRRVTMRTIYSTLASQYDPLGYITPFTTLAKVLVRELWAQERGWDDPLPQHLEEKWKAWEQELPTLQRIQLPRSYFSPSIDLETSLLTLHVFCDASELAYGSVAYVRAEEPAGDVHVSFVLARSRVAPKKQQSIPRLELCAALNGAQLGRFLLDELQLPLRSVTMWSDSTTVLTWLKSSSCRYKVFVGTRVAEILESTEARCWRYVDTKRNPADVITRGATLQDLAEHHLYHAGPDFLLEQESEWPATPALAEEREDTELRKTLFCGATQVTDPETPPGGECEMLEELQKKMFCLKAGLPPETTLSAEDYIAAELLVLQSAQQDAFSRELECLEKGKPIPSDSRLCNLAPELDGDLIRVGGRRRRASDIDVDTKHPIVLPAKHRVTRLVIKHHDNKVQHAGGERVFAEVRRRYWILHGREAVRRYQRSCMECQRWRATPPQPMMSDLPEDRLRLRQAPFHSTGVDCFGPLTVRNRRASEKRWGIIYTCLTTRAMHLEVLHHLTTDSFLMSFKRFASRRGTPKTLRSDRGTNFVGGEAELRESYASMTEEARDRLAEKQVKFEFNPPNAPHFGGAWEREIRSVKNILRTVLGQQVPTDEVLETVLVEIEGILNSRPLGYTSSDVADLDPITPSFLLMGRRDSSLPQVVYDPAELTGRRLWRHSQVLADQFWKQFILHYLPTLQVRQKWTKERDNLSEGAVVLVIDQSLPRAAWQTGRVTKVLPGRDGRVRTAIVDVAGRTYTRPVARLIELPRVAEDTITSYLTLLG